MTTAPTLATTTVTLTMAASDIRIDDRFRIPSGLATLTAPVHTVQRKGSTYAILTVTDRYDEPDTIRWPANKTVEVIRTMAQYSPNMWGSDPNDVDPNEFCVECEREVPFHYEGCPTRTATRIVYVVNWASDDFAGFQWCASRTVCEKVAEGLGSTAHVYDVTVPIDLEGDELTNWLHIQGWSDGGDPR